jgi:hypothetical protein
MSNSIWQIIASTPWWVFVIFFYLLRMGYLATKPRVITLSAMLMFPLLLAMGSFTTIFYYLSFTLDHILIWVAGFLLGIGLGYIHYRFLNIKAISNTQSLYITGSWSLLLIILLIFGIKYYFGYEIAINPNLFAQKEYAFSLLALYGMLTGFFAGRLSYAANCLKNGPFLTEEELQEKLSL